MSQTKLEAHFENRTYYFYLQAKSPDKISITMYGGGYTFLNTEKGWVNAPSNKNIMAQGLVTAVAEIVG